MGQGAREEWGASGAGHHDGQIMRNHGSFLPCVGGGVSVGYMQYTGNADDALARTSIVGVCGTANACYAAATGAQCSSSR